MASHYATVIVFLIGPILQLGGPISFFQLSLLLMIIEKLVHFGIGESGYGKWK